MGRRWSRKRKKENAQAKAGGERKKKPPSSSSYAPTVQGNIKMESYYALQGLHNHYYLDGTETLVPCETDEQREQERLKWLTSLQSMLPASFRIGQNVHPELQASLEQEMSKFVGTEMEIEMDPVGERRVVVNNSDDKQQEEVITKQMIAPVRRIPFIPHAFQLSLDRRTIRRNPALNDFHAWLISQTASGFITRQETVSMIPPVVLSVEPHHSVLDMCAAPGSKTSQILEIVSLPTEPGDLEPRGCVVANDSDPKRAYMLVNQLKRINSPAALVTSCDAQFFPLLLKKDGEEGMFDRVLADVPCSGDGTTRKNPGIWKHWNAHGSLALHPLQLGIALNGARLTKVGGYLCYSTCSMNPIENEAVVVELLRAADGALELVDKRPDMPGLKARPGWRSWRVMFEDKTRREVKDQQKKNNSKMQARRKEWEEQSAQENGGEPKSESKDDDTKIDDSTKDQNETKQVETVPDPNRFTSTPPTSWDEATLLQRAQDEGLVEYKSFEDVPEDLQGKIRKTVFPPTPEEAAKFGLEKCLRCLPHDMDTGGFFVALFRKVKPLSAKARREALELAQEFHPEDVDSASASGPDTKRTKTGESTSAGNSEVDDSEAVTGAETDVGIETTDVDDAIMEPVSTTDADNVEMASVSEAKGQDDTKQAPSNAAMKKPNTSRRGKTQGVYMSDSLIPMSDDVWKPLVDYYGFSETFPRDQYMARARGEAKSLYFIGAPIKKLIDNGIQERVTIINSGLKGFARNNKECQVNYRVAQEGIHYLAPHMTKRKVYAGLKDFAECLNTGNIGLEMFSDEFAAAVRPMDPGSFVVVLKGYDQDIFHKMIVVMWRCRGDAVTCLVTKVEMDGMKSKVRAIPESEEDKAVSAPSGEAGS